LFNAGTISRKIRNVTSSAEIAANISSKVSLSCWIDFVQYYCPDKLLWKFNDEEEPLPESGKKYKVELKDTNSKCQKEFVLSIFNVTESDMGTYSCHWLCKHLSNTRAAIALKVYDNPSTGKNIERSNAREFIFLSQDCATPLLIHMDYLTLTDFLNVCSVTSCDKDEAPAHGSCL